MENDSKATILLVDDDRVSLSVLSAGLRSLGYGVRTALSGEEALQACENEPPDLAILDMQLPGLSGIETARELRSRTQIPFLFLSAHSDKDMVSLAAGEGALGYLVKPLDVMQVSPSIEAALSRAAEFRSLQERENNLHKALVAGRDTSVAVGLVMERYRLDRNAAFEALRLHARSQRRKLEEVAAEIVKSAERVNLPPKVLTRAVEAKPQD